MFLYPDLVQFCFWPRRFKSCQVTSRQYCDELMKSAPWTYHLEVCRKSAWRPVVDWMSCGFGRLSRLQVQVWTFGCSPTTWKQKNNMADSDKHVFFGKYVHTIKLPAAPRGHVNQTEEGKGHMREQTPLYVQLCATFIIHQPHTNTIVLKM